MRLLATPLAVLLLFSVLGCGGSTTPQTMDVSQIDSYVTENPEAVAKQKAIAAARDAEDNEED